MSELEEFMKYLENKAAHGSASEEVSDRYYEFKRAKAKPKGFHKDCTSTKHNIGAFYCSECQP